MSVNVRIIAATNKNLVNEVNAGRFREDLFYRLNVVPMDVVPLRQRGNDILLLFNHFLEFFSNDLGLDIPEVEEGAKEILLNYKWPGNVRELRNVVQRLVLTSNGVISAKALSSPTILRDHVLMKEETSFEDMFQGQVLPLKDMEKSFRVKYIKYVRSISYSDSNAAEKLGLAPSNFYRMCKELGIK